MGALFSPSGAGNLLETVSEWQETLQVMCSLTATKREDRETGQLTIGGLVRLLVASVGPSLATKVIDSVGVVGGGALGEEGVEVHSLLVELAGIHAEQRFVVLLVIASEQVVVQGSVEVTSGEGGPLSVVSTTICSLCRAGDGGGEREGGKERAGPEWFGVEASSGGEQPALGCEGVRERAVWGLLLPHLTEGVSPAPWTPHLWLWYVCSLCSEKYVH